MQHSFDIEIAQMYGVNAAIILNNLHHWIKRNEANEQNFFDGRYWTYNSRRAYRELFPYMGERQINTAFQKLIDDGVIVTGNYNKSAYDRTLWYALTEKGKSILHYDGFHYDEMSNGSGGNIKPIPNINTDVTADKKTDIYKRVVGFLNEKAGTAYKAKSKATQEKINARLNEGFTVEDFETVISKKCDEWKGTDMEQYLRPETLFGPKFENYLNAKINKGRGNNNGAGYGENRERVERESTAKWGNIGTTL